jgi:hypothetical protein
VSKEKIYFKMPRSTPVEVRDANMRLIVRGLSSEELEVEAGEYFVQAILPSNEALVKRVTVKPGPPTTIDFTSHEFGEDAVASVVENAFATRNSAFPSYEIAAEPSAPRIDTAPRTWVPVVKRAPRPSTLSWKFRFVTLENWTLRSVDTVEIEDVDIDDSGTTTLTIHNPETAVVFASIATEGTIPTNVALPAVGVMDSQRCQLVVTTGSDGGMAQAFPVGSAIENPARYLADGDLRSASQYITAEYAEQLLRGKMMDPLAAALGGYVLLAQGELERMHDWSGNLADWFKYMSDGSAIEGERLALLGEHEAAYTRFMQLGERGLPIFTNGFSMALSRLRHYSDFGEDRAPRTPDAARKLVARLDSLSAFTDFGALTLTIRTSSLDHPTSEQGQEPPNFDDAEWASI